MGGGGGGHVKFYTYEKGGGEAETVLAMLEPWGHKVLGSFFTL